MLDVTIYWWSIWFIIIGSLNWFIFSLRLGWINLGPQMIHMSDLCPIITQHLQTIFFLTWIAAIASWGEAVSLLLEYEFIKRARALIWRSRFIWGSNHVQIKEEATIITPCLDSCFTIIAKEFDEVYHMECNECLEFITIWKGLHISEEKSFRREILPREIYLFIKSENYAVKIIKFFSLIEGPGDQLRLDTTIHDSNTRGSCMDNYGYNITYWYLIIVCSDKLAGFKFHGIFDTGVIFQNHKKGVA